jgi:hypothetical protein
MKALKQVLFVGCQQSCRLVAAENGSKAAWKAAKQLRNTRAGLRQQAHQRTSILDRDGEEVTEPEQVVEVFRQHYETLTLTSATTGTQSTCRNVGIR